MDVEFDYFDSGLQMALTVLALSLILIVDFSHLSTLVFLIGVPLLLGFTAYISHDSFRIETLASSIGFVFIPLGGFIAASAAMIFMLNVFVSFFSSGEGFRNYYSATALPLLLLGVVLGGSLASMAVYSPNFESQIEQSFVDKGADSTMKMIELTGTGVNQEEAVRNATYSNVVLTEKFVVGEYAKRADNPDIETLRDVFVDARENVTNTVVNQSEVVDRRGRVEGALEEMVSGKIAMLVLLFSVSLLYTLQPLIGILTAISGFMFKAIEEVISES